VAQAEQALVAQGGDATLPLARSAARSLARLMSYKDEYEVARLYTDGSFQQRLREQFDGDLRLAFHMAPPLLARGRDGQPPRKLTLGAWLMPAMRLLARARALRGTALDPFGHTDERRLERALIPQFEARLAELAAGLSPRNQALAAQIAAVPLAMRGYGHVKLANVALARAREAELLHRFDPQRHPRPQAAAQAGQIRGIAVVAAGGAASTTKHSASTTGV
jgi:indolepyruvate ferredoxin oxidoreductase